MPVHLAAVGSHDRHRDHAGHRSVRRRPQKPIRIGRGLSQRTGTLKNKNKKSEICDDKKNQFHV